MAYVVGACLFLHCPKTGGKAVLSALRAAGNRVRPVRSPRAHNGHARESELRDRRYRWDVRWGFVRHPVGWWVSLRDFAATPDSPLFKIAPKICHPLRPILDDCRRLRGEPAEEFVGDMVGRWPGFYSDMLAGYYGGDLARVEWLGRTENLAADLRHFCRVQGLRVPEVVGRVNVSQPPARGPLTAGTVQAVEAAEAWTVSKFYSGGCDAEN